MNKIKKDHVLVTDKDKDLGLAMVNNFCLLVAVLGK